MSETYIGGCLCGAVRLAATPPAKFCTYCHCSQCRRAHGAPVVAWVGFREEQFEITEGSEQLRRFTTETGATRSFCQRCGTTLLFESGRWAGEVHVTLVSLDDPGDLRPRAPFYVDHGAEWHPILDELPRFGGESGGEERS